jgi:hypothetical protein
MAVYEQDWLHNEWEGMTRRGRVSHFKSAHRHSTCASMHTIVAVIEHLQMNIST